MAFFHRAVNTGSIVLVEQIIRSAGDELMLELLKLEDNGSPPRTPLHSSLLESSSFDVCKAAISFMMQGLWSTRRRGDNSLFDV